MLYGYVLFVSYFLPLLIAGCISLERRLHWRTFLLAMLGLLIAPLCINTLVAICAAPFHHDGFCYGMTDGKWACTLFQQIKYQADLAFLFTLFLNIVWLVFLSCLTAGNLLWRCCTRAHLA
ncbi:MAG: hypothetical protein AAGA53_02090 [Pseudomonadota bacterium]